MALSYAVEHLSAFARSSTRALMRASVPLNRRSWNIGYGLIILLFAWLMSNVPLVAMFHSADYDAGLFVRQAENLLSGLWLGPYDNLTLLKGPFYPVWIAFGWLIGLPILVTQGLAYALSCLLLVRGLRPWLRSEPAAYAVFLVILFNPATYSLGQLGVMREGIYVPLTILIFALVAWWFRWRDRPLLRRAGVAAGLGAVIGMFWCTREEGVWVVPSLAICFGILLGACLNPVSGSFRNRLLAAVPALKREAALAGLTIGVTAAVVGWFSWMNLRHYGIADIVELKQHEFLSGYGALSRIRHKERWDPYVVVPRETLERAYAVSPAALELRPYFNGPGHAELVDGGCYVYNVIPCDGEIRTGWFIFALRDAAAQAGHYRTALEARAFYARLSDEIATACDDGRLDCLPPRATVAPPFRREYVRPALRRTGSMLDLMVSQRDLTIPNHPMSCFRGNCGGTAAQGRFLDITNSSLFVDALQPEPYGAPLRKVKDNDPLIGLRSGLVRSGLEVMISIYRLALPWLTGIALAACLIMLGEGAARRRIEPLLLVAGVAAVVVASRILLVGCLDSVGMLTANTLYLSPAYPALLLFGATAVLAAAYMVNDRVMARRDRSKSVREREQHGNGMAIEAPPTERDSNR